MSIKYIHSFIIAFHTASTLEFTYLYFLSKAKQWAREWASFHNIYMAFTFRKTFNCKFAEKRDKVRILPKKVKLDKYQTHAVSDIP